MIYFDNSAATKPYPEVIDTYAKVCTQFFANPSSLHNLGEEAERLLSSARQQIAELLQINKEEVIFAASGTEANNIAIKGTVFEHQGRGKHLITTKVEHASIYETYRQLERMGFSVTYLSVNEYGMINIDELKDAIRDDTILVSLSHVNNELGTIQPLMEIGSILKNYPKLYFHVDYVQGVTKVPLSFKDCHIDLCTISSHKFHGPKGVAMLYVRDGIKLTSLITGGPQENNFRAGTENLAGITAMAKALRLSLEQFTEKEALLKSLQQRLISELKQIDGVTINSPLINCAPHITNFSIVNLKPEVVTNMLGEKGIYISTKSACSSKLTKASRVLTEVNIGKERAESAFRISLSFENTMDEILLFIKELKAVIAQLN